MVKVIESQRPLVGIAGRRKRPSRREESFVYYTATNGQTILENESQVDAPDDALNTESPSSTVIVATDSTNVVTQSRRKRTKRNLYKRSIENTGVTTLCHDYMDMLDEPHQPTTKTDTSVQVSVDDDDHKSSERSDNNSYLPVIEDVTNNSNNVSFRDEQIDILMKRLQEKDAIIAELLQSTGTSLSTATTMDTENTNAKIAQSMQVQLEEQKRNYDHEVAKLKLEVTKWKDKASNMSLELESLKCNSTYRRSVYNVRFLLEEVSSSESSGMQSQNQQHPIPSNNDNTTAIIHDEPQSTNGKLSLQKQQQNIVCFDNKSEAGSHSNGIRHSNEYRSKQPKQPLVSPRTLHNVTYLGKPLFFQHHLEKKSKFQLMVVSPTSDSEDDNV